MPTTHYLIHSPSTGRTLKVSYRGGNYFRLEQVAGPKFKNEEMTFIGIAVPALEKDMEFYKREFPRLEYTRVEKEQGIHQQYVSAWFGFYERFMGIAPKFTAADGAALKQIKSYLTRTSGTEQLGLDTFRMVLDNWDRLEDFHKKNTDLKYINSRLNVILNGIKKAGQAGTRGTDQSVSV